MISRKELTAYFDGLLNPSVFKDSTHNGLQVEGKEKVERVGFAVDSSLDIYRKAAEKKCEYLVVHHGLIWGGMRKVTGYQRDRLALLLAEGISLYVSHLPLDKHPELGNNARIVKKLGAKAEGEVGEVGLAAVLKAPVPFDRFVAAAKELFEGDVRTLHFNEEKIRKIAVCSGAVQLSFLQEALEKGVTTVLTGEGSGESMFVHPARENRMNVLFAGHTQTETFGIRALMERFQKDYKEKAEAFYVQV